MYYAPSKRIEIGRRVFAHELTKKEAAAEYDVTEQSICQYVRECLKSAGIDAVPKEGGALSGAPDCSSMTKEELVREIMRKGIEAARAKKGYAVKGGGGKSKEFVSIKDASAK